MLPLLTHVWFNNEVYLNEQYTQKLISIHSLNTPMPSKVYATFLLKLDTIWVILKDVLALPSLHWKNWRVLSFLKLQKAYISISKIIHTSGLINVFWICWPYLGGFRLWKCIDENTTRFKNWGSLQCHYFTGKFQDIFQKYSNCVWLCTPWGWVKYCLKLKLYLWLVSKLAHMVFC